MTDTAATVLTTSCCSRRDLLRGVTATTGAVVVGGALVACSEGTDPGASVDEASGAAGQVVVALADVPVGGAVSGQVGGVEVLVTQPVEGEVHVFSAVCTHQGCTVLPGDGVLECPCHRSTFALTDAAVQSGPAPEPLGEVPVEVVDGDVVVA
ncbi:Rieske (2Fe-2S) protein [Isoptericola dokdonensis]|uniref:Cytochrome bc1 complex Rieske iron-sulfur subunit n=1 Tax=Isoptericola dokdonensis DS-3 TaxID=1300344 RepID=A0A161IJU8_9MICO|nr:Rieske (2Fe-2S) protein [Isoptericola dokdonensis]ANC30520.1 Biphenyl dioxygenase system ferredoxin subunit [Isoptericola dokdonensis DS-3]